MMKKVPKRRFKGFLNAGDWEQRKLGECMNSFAYGLNAAAKGYDGMHKYIRITDIDDETHNFIQSNLASPDIDFNMDVSHYKLNVGDIVFARTGASVGKTYLYNPNDGDLYYAGFLIRGKVKEDCDSGFIYQNTLTKDYDSFIKITSQRSGQPGVNSKEYAIFRLNIPCKDEQEKISKVLNSLDELFTLHQRKLEKLQATKKALLYELFPIENSRRPKRRFKGFTGDWEQRKFKDIAFKRGKISEADLPYVEFEDINSGIGTLNKNILQKVGHKKGILFEAGDVLFGKLRPYLQNWLLCQFMGIAVGDFWVFQPQIVSSAFLYYLIQSEAYQSVVNISSGTKMPRSSWSLVSETHCSIPKYKEATMIGEFLTSIDKNITLHQRKLEKLKNLKAAYLNEMFV